MTQGYNQIGTWRPLDGTVAGDVLSFQVRDGLWTGDLTVTGEQMSGPARQQTPGGGSSTYELTFQRINSTSSLPSQP